MKSGEYQVTERTGKKELRAKVDDYVLVEYYLDKYILHYIYKSGDKNQDIFKTEVLDFLNKEELKEIQIDKEKEDSGGYVIDVNAI